MKQGDLFGKRRKSIAEAFEKFDRENPEVWALFVRFSFDVIAAGHKRFSSDAVVHRIRWFTNVETTTYRAKGWKINDNWTALYARKFLKLFPDRVGFFELRVRREALR